MDDDEAFECRPCGAEAAPLRTLDTALRRETTQRAASASASMDARTALSVVQQKYEVQCSAACKNHRAQFHAKHGKPKGCNHLLLPEKARGAENAPKRQLGLFLVCAQSK